ncbi:MAG: radical SAM protein [Proteobacteria bacterium]|nr:radical SAM protein [Pseudomonadota bacterium]MBU4389644.1 radical SAM protein [Pseudomonadota bacterium]MBU4503424.1 radical SAM protein [Pseudomonadota bacterium]
MSYKYIFGPVPSRRLGLSLGIDLMPHKTCTLNCVYCECGRTTNLTLKCKEYIPTELLQEELKDFLSRNPKLDFITFSGSGEPTLHTGIKEIINFIKKDYPKYKIALLTNSTLFFQPDNRKRIAGVDMVIASLDAASEENFKKINRPHPGLELSRIIEGLVSLRKEFAKQLWMEVFLVPGINDKKDELNKIKKALSPIYPDKIQLNTLDRPGAESWVKPASQKDLLDAASYLNSADVIKNPDSMPNDGVLNKDDCKYLLSIIKRRPCTAEDISKISDSNLEEIYRHLDALIEKGLIIKKNMPRGMFYMAKS